MSRTAWDVVQMARDLDRPTTQYFIRNIFTDFVEMHGDKLFANDAAIIGGVGLLDGRPVTVIGQEKGVSLSEKARCNFGSAHPEGYRKSLRLMKQAEKFSRPVICIVDTQGAFCGVGAEERGVAEAIARNLLEMSRLKTPIVSVLIGEGGSGGAIALAVSDRLAMLENSMYSILSPEGFSSILWKEAARAPEAAELMRLTADEVRDMGIVDTVISEPPEGAKANDGGAIAQHVKQYLTESLASLDSLSLNELLEQRYEKFRNFGSRYVTVSEPDAAKKTVSRQGQGETTPAKSVADTSGENLATRSGSAGSGQKSADKSAKAQALQEPSAEKTTPKKPSAGSDSEVSAEGNRPKRKSEKSAAATPDTPGRAKHTAKNTKDSRKKRNPQSRSKSAEGKKARADKAESSEERPVRENEP